MSKFLHDPVYQLPTSYTLAKWELPNRRKGTVNTWEGSQILTGNQTQILTDPGPDLGLNLGANLGPDLGPDSGPDLEPNLGPDLEPNLGPWTLDLGSDLGLDLGSLAERTDSELRGFFESFYLVEGHLLTCILPTANSQ